MTDSSKDIDALLAGWWNGESYDVSKEDLKALIAKENIKSRIDEVERIAKNGITTTYGFKGSIQDNLLRDRKSELEAQLNQQKGDV